MRQFLLRDYIKNIIRIFFLGIIVGIMIMFFLRGRLQTDIYLLNEDWILSLQSGYTDSKSLFVYILLKRLKEIGLLFLLSTTFVGILYVYGYTAALGVGMGVLLAVSCLRYGIKGLLLFLLALFPQTFIYIPAFIYILHLCYMICVKLYFPHKDYSKSSSSMKVFIVKNVICICIAVSVVIIGILIESYVNPKIFFSYIKKF